MNLEEFIHKNLELEELMKQIKLMNEELNIIIEEKNNLFRELRSEARNQNIKWNGTRFIIA